MKVLLDENFPLGLLLREPTTPRRAQPSRDRRPDGYGRIVGPEIISSLRQPAYPSCEESDLVHSRERVVHQPLTLMPRSGILVPILGSRTASSRSRRRALRMAAH